MNFSSDNAAGVLPEILAALAEAAPDSAMPYGDDPVTGRLAGRLSTLFERPVAAFPVLTGTAANALALASVTPPHGAVLCHRDSHLNSHECGAPEFYSGAKLIGLEGAGARITAGALSEALAGMERGFVHSVQSAAISLSQPTELGTVYPLAAVAAIGALAKAEGLALHLDGARFANALAHLGCTPAEATWKCGVDILSFGASKGGAMAAEAVIFFDPAQARDFEYRRKRGGHLVSKMRFVSAQVEAFVRDGLWLKSASRANALAARLAEGLAGLPDVRLAAPVETNMVFAAMPAALAARLRAAGAVFYDWHPPRNGRVTVRLATSFATPEADIDRFIALAKQP